MLTMFMMWALLVVLFLMESLTSLTVAEANKRIAKLERKIYHLECEERMREMDDALTEHENARLEKAKQKRDWEACPLGRW